MIIDEPAVIPVTNPVAKPTEALVLLLLQVPPLDVLLRLVVRPAQTEVAPEIAAGKGLIVIIVVTKQPVLNV